MPSRQEILLSIREASGALVIGGSNLLTKG